MKETEKKKPIPTIPKGVWESTRPVKDKTRSAKNISTPAADLQGNGYPSDMAANPQGNAGSGK